MSGKFFRASIVYVTAMPYLMLGVLWLCMGITVNKVTLIVLAVSLGLLGMLGVPACIVCNVASLTYLNDKDSANRNRITKLCYIPMYILLVFFSMGMMNPFLLWASWVPLVLCGSLLTYSGAANIGACVNLLCREKCSFKEALLLGIFSFVGIADLIAAEIQMRKSAEGA